jgi:hypothetical protein
MAKSKTATADPDTIWVQLGNQQRTSAGDYSPPGIVELPADEARALIQAGLATPVEVAS